MIPTGLTPLDLTNTTHTPAPNAAVLACGAGSSRCWSCWENRGRERGVVRLGQLLRNVWFFCPLAGLMLVAASWPLLGLPPFPTLWRMVSSCR